MKMAPLHSDVRVYDLNDSALSKPAKVEKVNIIGVQRTKSDIIAKKVGGIFKVQTVEELLPACVNAQQSLVHDGLFKSVDLDVDTSKGPSKDGYDVTFKVEEHNRMRFSLNTSIGTNEGSLDTGIELPNTFGRAEKLKATLTSGTRRVNGMFGLNEVSINFQKPINGNPNLLWSLGTAQPTREYPWSGYKEIDRLLFTGLHFKTLLGLHTIQWGAAWRELTSLNKAVDMSIREQFGHSLKSSVTHTLKRDTRDHPVFPTRGYLAQSETEVAGLGGDAKFIKSDLMLHYNCSILEHLVAQLTLAGGCAKALQPETDLHLSDRFFLGGPLSMRGYTMNGCGPRSEGCSVGGNVYVLGGAHLYSPLPFRAKQGGFSDAFRIHAWAQAGNLVNVDYSNLALKQLGRDLAEGMRFSYGVGLVLNFLRIARLELNYCIPYKANSRDSISPGWQFGIGIAFS